jgi:CRP-like cAMP-binding protein
MQLGTGSLTTIQVGAITWAFMGKGDPGELDEEQHQEIHRTLLDYCLMQTGQTLAQLDLFQRMPALCTLFTAIGDVKLKVKPPDHVQDLNVEAKARALVRLPKTMREIFSERLRMTFVKQGEVIYEEERRGLEMYFVHSGKVEFLQWNKAKAKGEEEIKEIGCQTNIIKMAAEQLITQTAILADDGEIGGSAPPGFSFAGHRRSDITQMKLDNFQVIATLGEGAQFGELSLLKGTDGCRRMSSAVAVEDTQLFSLHVEDLAVMAEVRETPSFVVASEVNLFFL